MDVVASWHRPGKVGPGRLVRMIARAALGALFALDGRTPVRGLYDALHRSRLSVEEVGVHGRHTEVRLSGELRLGGTCDVARIQAQIVETVPAASGSRDVDVHVNGEPLATLLSGQ